MLHIEDGTQAQRKAGRSAAYADIAAHLPHYAARVVAQAGLHVQTARVLESETTVALRLEAVEGPVVLKISPHRDDLRVSTYFFERLTALGPQAVPAPRVLLFDPTCTTIPYEFQIMEWLDGSDARALPPELHHAAGRVVGQSLRCLHRLAADGFGRPRPEGGWTAHTWHEVLRQTYRFDVAAADAPFTPREASAVAAAIFGDARTDVAMPCLLHGDVVVSNALFRVEDGQVVLAVLIDPGSIVGGDPMFDLAGGADTGDHFARGLWQGYTATTPLSAEEAYRYRRLLLLSLLLLVRVVALGLRERRRIPDMAAAGARGSADSSGARVTCAPVAWSVGWLTVARRVHTSMILNEYSCTRRA
jgi:aminoglycoside phosphotransferase (APT) family kinase protein